MTNGVCVLFGKKMERTRLRLWITTNCYEKDMEMTDLLEEIYPGEILLEEFMKPMGITARQLSADIDVPPSRISDIVNGNRPITADTALRLGLFFGMEPRYWLNLQSEYDMRIATRELMPQVAPRVRVFER
jgi:antitoxin HigA-1